MIIAVKWRVGYIGSLVAITGIFWWAQALRQLRTNFHHLSFICTLERLNGVRTSPTTESYRPDLGIWYISLWLFDWCIAGVLCKFPGNPVNGFTSPTRASYDIGQEITFECVEGFTLVGTEKSECTEKGSFSGTLPSCTSKHVWYLECDGVIHCNSL